jgi:hypothetical protein
MAVSQLVKDFVWTPIAPETLHLPALPANLATTADVNAAKQTLEAQLEQQTAALGQQLLTAVGAEQLVNDAIKDSVVQATSDLIQLQNTAFATINGRIDNVATSVTNVADSVAVVSSSVALVDGKVGVVAGNVTAVQGAVTAIEGSVSTISTELGTTKTTLATAVQNNTEQDLALDELVKGVIY